jgi:hypothetical protein
VKVQSAACTIGNETVLILIHFRLRMADNAAVDILRIIDQDLDGLLGLSDIVSLMTSCRVLSDQPSEAAQALQLFRGNDEWKTPFARKMLAEGVRPLNVYRARAVMEIHEKLRAWTVGDAALTGTGFTSKNSDTSQNSDTHSEMAGELYNSQIADPYDAQWTIIVLSMKVWVWRNAAVLTLSDMEAHMNEIVDAWPDWTVHGQPRLG